MLQKKNLVIVEDDADLLNTLGFLFKEEGYSVWQFERGKKMFEKISQIKPGTVIIDMMLPDIKGEDLALSIKNDKDFKKVRVILISASDNLESKAKSSKADAFLLKPFSFEKLVNLIKSNHEEGDGHSRIE